MSTEPATVYLSDYTSPAYLVDEVALDFELGDEETLVHSRLQVHRAGHTAPGSPLVLDGEDLALEALAIDDRPLDATEFDVDERSLTIAGVPERFTLSVTTRLRPQDNTRLEGLYRSGGMFCTQCEAEGFRRITYFPDRPDVMARYTVTITADRGACPILLSNGNPVGSGELDDGRHWVRWHDPFPKPSYLFALVAGDLHCHEDRHTTPSGRDIRLAIYTEHANAGRTAHAMRSLKAAMAWDERTYGLECDLDNYLVVAVGDFNMGAMENKGLNIFNTQYILARPDVATDADYTNIEAVIGHEYFHNWTGNRVTLRDWFQLSLKEGLTVFREQQFSADRGAPAVRRIQEVRTLRAAQFPEDASPMAHPVRPGAYAEINNFYTATVYMKGAEVIRMYHTLLGQEGFRRGLDLYFRRHDGQAVTCEDFLAAMADANDVDLGQFARWYNQSGTPVMRVSDEYDPADGRLTLTVTQETAPTADQPDKAPLHIPLAIGLVGADGADLPVRLAGETDAPAPGTRVLDVREPEQRFVVEGLTERPVPSLLRGFSAPVRLDYDYTDEQLAFLFANDSDAFNRWEAGQRLATRILLRWVENGVGEVPATFVDAFRETLNDTAADPALVAEALTLPGEGFIAEQMAVIEVDAIHEAREHLRAALARALAADLRTVYTRNAVDGPYRPEAEDMGRRRLRNVALDYLATVEDDALARCLAHYREADNMTDTMAALALLADRPDAEAEAALEAFAERWRDDPLVLDKWFRVQALSRREDAFERVRALAAHPAFDPRNPNRLRSLIGAFCQGNAVRFHRADGAGYTFLADWVIELDGMNPQVAARLAKTLSRWRRYDPRRSEAMRAALERIEARPALSKDVGEVVARSLERSEDHHNG
ncbi:aminopeptidase N [Arhodomonas aquaeolei]|uniref:aminopeptidase N n=1 Tax=Arhodomonas aquaeolei TaxID=2369 RepID=UPI00216A7D7D|nr:aminopeptidase N [Arhodomonas aquaeolei]MCS4503236.1 aminopeptidase N [Arhodomonas aquaeolei]